MTSSTATLRCIALLRLGSMFTISTAFSPTIASTRTSLLPTGHSMMKKAPLRALIYGWDGGDDDDEECALLEPPIPSSSTYEGSLDQCSVSGMEIAQEISYDPDRLASLARLAVAFSPQDRQLDLKQIEKVDILCVSNKHIDLQAVICENGGCVSLAVPIQFPKSCSLDDDDALQGCVVSHLEDLDENSASTVLAMAESEASGYDLSWDLGASLEYPSWWVHPSTPDIISECQSMCAILNEYEFQPEVLALVKQAMKDDWSGYVATDARVARISPAGFCFKVKASMGTAGSLDTSPTVRLLDVFSPFPNSAVKTSVDELRAAILGTVATAS